jgi:hypothetical protein
MSINFVNAHRGTLRVPNTDSSSIERYKSLRTCGIPTSDQITGLELRLSKVYIKDNKHPKMWPFIKYSNLYFIVSTIDNLGGEPTVISVRGFADVDDGEQLPVDKTVYYWKSKSSNNTAPGQIHFLGSIIKSNEKIRDFGNALLDLRKTDDFKDIVKSVIVAAVTSGGTLITDSLISLAGVIGSILGNVDDNPLITTVQSFTDINGNFDALGRHVYKDSNRYVDLETTLIIRDTNREP